MEPLKEQLTNLMQARIGWAKAEAYAEDVVAYMERKNMLVAKEHDLFLQFIPLREGRDETDN